MSRAAATVAMALAAYAAGASASLLRGRRRRPRRERIDPFTLGESWRGPVKAAMQASARYHQLLRSLPPGPLRDRLGDIGRSIERSVDECWRVAQRGDTLTSALSAIDVATARRQLAELPEDTGDDVVGRSLRARLASAERLETVAEGARQRLTELEARLHQAVAAAVELSQRPGEGADATLLSSDVDDVVDQLSALRTALDEADDIGQ